MAPGPVITSKEQELMAVCDASSTIRASNFSELPLGDIEGKVVYRSNDAESNVLYGVPDDNRSIIFPDMVIEIGGREYAMSVKGVGARTPMYGEKFRDILTDDLKTVHDANNSRMMTGESWFGEAPYGAQGEISALMDIEITELARGCSLNGFHICPVVEINILPEKMVTEAKRTFWYKRHSGPYYQEIRLVPSDIRLYHQSDITLGRTLREALLAMGISTVEDMDSFIDRYISSGVAALTLYTRTLRPCSGSFKGLCFEDVWLDKDSLLSSDGTLHFADIEGLDWHHSSSQEEIERKVTKQFGRNYYEFMYSLDLLLRERERLASRPLGQRERRVALVERASMALSNDQFVDMERASSSADLVLRSGISGFDDIVLRFLDEV